MSAKWLELVKKKLDPEDKLQVEYLGRFDGKSGWLSMSNKKLIFVEEKGLLFRTYEFAQEISYEKIKDITLKRKRNSTH